jgi:RDD family
MSSAQRDIQRVDVPGAETEADLEPFALKQQIAEKVAAHRARKNRPAGPQLAEHTPSPTRTRSASIAAAVAERYAHSQSYRAFLAEEAEKAIREAEAAAEIARRNAEAVAVAQYELLAELDELAAQPLAPQPLVPSLAPTLVLTPLEPSAPQETPTPRLVSQPATQPRVETTPAPSLRVKLDVSLPAPQQVAPTTPVPFDENEATALDEEIAFRQDPIFEEAVPPVEIPANLIEFPRQLVAPRRARPRLAEGPLREENDVATSQLRIFEVETTQISDAPVVESVAPEWTSLLLSPQPAPEMVQPTPDAPYMPQMSPQTAPLSLRLMAAIVDAVAVSASLMIFVAIFALTANHFGKPGSLHMDLKVAAIGIVGALAVFGLVYQLLFFTFSDSTLGMRYARIGLCTFSDDNPTRAAMRRRIFAHLLSAGPLGIGYLWAMLDDDRLGWHDRITRMYQRSY